FDPERAELIKWAFEVYATGEYSLTRLTDELQAKGLTTQGSRRHSSRPVPRSTVARFLHNPYYAGTIRFNGISQPGRHEPLIDQETFNRVQQILTAHALSGEKQRKHRPYLVGTLFCGYCGRRMCFALAKGKGGQYPYFFCTGMRNKPKPCGQRYVS